MVGCLLVEQRPHDAANRGPRRAEDYCAALSMPWSCVKHHSEISKNLRTWRRFTSFGKLLMQMSRYVYAYWHSMMQNQVPIINFSADTTVLKSLVLIILRFVVSSNRESSELILFYEWRWNWKTKRTRMSSIRDSKDSTIKVRVLEELKIPKRTS